MEKHEDCVSEEWWAIKQYITRCYSDPILALCVIIGNMGEDWIPNTLVLQELKWWRWN